MKPPATVSITHFHEVHRPIMFGRPLAVVNLAHRPIHQHDAPGTQQRHHAPVTRPDVSVKVLTVPVREYALEVAPLLYHARKEFRSLGIECWIKFHRYPQRSRRRHQVSPRHWERRPIMKALFDGHIVPAENLQ